MVPRSAIEGVDDDRPLVLRTRARTALAADDGPRTGGAGPRGPGYGQAPLWRDEARVADAPRPDGIGRARSGLLHPATARRRGRRRSLGGQYGPRVAPPP